MTDVSVVVPTRDRPTLLCEAVCSALAQEETSLEVIVVDDGSREPISTALAALRDDRLRVVRHGEPLGRSAARNAGIASAAGTWVAFLDDDDVWAPGKLRAQLSEADRTGAVWVYTGDVVVDERLEILAGHPPAGPEEAIATLGHHNPLPAGASNVLVRRDILDVLGGFDTGLHRTEDWDLWLRLARYGIPAYVARPLVGYRMRFGQGAVDARRIIAEPDLLAARYGLDVDRTAIRRRAGWACLLAGQRGQAVGHYLRAALAGDWRSVARAAVVAAHPPGTTAAVFRCFVPRDAAWEQQARGWLAELAAASGAERTP